MTFQVLLTLKDHRNNLYDTLDEQMRLTRMQKPLGLVILQLEKTIKKLEKHLCSSRS